MGDGSEEDIEVSIIGLPNIVHTLRKVLVGIYLTHTVFTAVRPDVLPAPITLVVDRRVVRPTISPLAGAVGIVPPLPLMPGFDPQFGKPAFDDLAFHVGS